MKLFLSSKLLSDQPQAYAALFGINKKVAVIMNAADVFGPEKRPHYMQLEIDSLRDIGLEAEGLDLRDYFGKKEALAQKLQTYGGVWVTGGNSFVLRRAMRQSGFDQVAMQLIKQNQLVYGGYSAGAALAGPSLEGINLVPLDDPHQLPPGYEPDVIWEGLGLYGSIIAPHYKSDHPESAAMDKVVEYLEREGLAHTKLRDGEAIIIDSAD